MQLSLTIGALTSVATLGSGLAWLCASTLDVPWKTRAAIAVLGAAVLVLWTAAVTVLAVALIAAVVYVTPP